MSDLDFDDTSPWGQYQPSLWHRACLALAHKVPAGLAPLTKLLRRPIKYGPKRPLDLNLLGYKIRVMSRGNMSEQKLYTAPQLFDVPEWSALRDTLKPGGVFVDIGANAGAYSLHAHNCIAGQGRIIAVEPDPEMQRRLRYNFSQNGIQIAEIHPVALSDSNGTATLQINPAQRGTNHLTETGPALNTIEVTQRTLLSLLQENAVTSIDVMKLDIEGHEAKVLGPFLRDAPESLLPKLIVSEFKPDSKNDILAALAGRHYVVQAQTNLNFICVIQS